MHVCWKKPAADFRGSKKKETRRVLSFFRKNKKELCETYFKQPKIGQREKEKETGKKKSRSNLKSVAGFMPCHPISFHCAETKLVSSVSGKEIFQRALSDS
jgi:hypothetical protein